MSERYIGQLAKLRGRLAKLNRRLGKLNRRLAAAAAAAAVVMLLLFLAPQASGYSSIIRNFEIEGAPGFRYEMLMFNPDNITFDIVNMTNKNVKFSATMTFVDIRGRIVAEVDLFPRRIAASSRSSYKSFFVMGSPEMARRSDRIIWRPRVSSN